MLSLPPSSATRGVLSNRGKGGILVDSTTTEQSYIVKDDLSNFTVDKWRNKVLILIVRVISYYISDLKVFIQHALNFERRLNFKLNISVILPLTYI